MGAEPVDEFLRRRRDTFVVMQAEVLLTQGLVAALGGASEVRQRTVMAEAAAQDVCDAACRSSVNVPLLGHCLVDA